MADKTSYTVVRSKDAFIVSIPRIDAVVERVINEIGLGKGLAVYKKAVMEGGKVSLKMVRKMLEQTNGKLTKNKRSQLRYGKTGALAASMKCQFRTSRSGLYSYAVIGADRDMAILTKRGNQAIYAQPGHYVHLVNEGFTAVARIPGVVGRQTHYQTVKSLKKIGKAMGIEKAHRLGMAKLLMAGTELYYDSRFEGQKAGSKYIKKYRAATTTVVPGQKFLQKAAADSVYPSTQKAMEVMQAEFDRMISNLQYQQAPPS
jgi:hypothetical protein